MEILFKNPSEKLVLIAAVRSTSGSLLSLRKETALQIDRFVSAIQFLESRELLSRDAARFKVLPAAIKWMASAHQTKGKLSSEDYFSLISVPQLSVSEFFLPNRDLFLKDICEL